MSGSLFTDITQEQTQHGQCYKELHNLNSPQRLTTGATYMCPVPYRRTMLGNEPCGALLQVT